VLNIADELVFSPSSIDPLANTDLEQTLKTFFASHRESGWVDLLSLDEKKLANTLSSGLLTK